MKIEELITQETVNQLTGYCILKTKGQLKRCNQCYKYDYRRCEDL